VTLNMYWQNQLNAAVLKPILEGEISRVAVLGIGSQLHGDDAVGIMIVRALKQNGFYNERLLVVNAGIAPENKLVKLRQFAPDLVLMIDAAQMGLEPGSVCCLDPQKIDGFSFSSHTLPLQVLCNYITLEIGSRVSILGIQPEDISFGAALSPLVSDSIGAVLPALVEILKPTHFAADLCVQEEKLNNVQIPGSAYDWLPVTHQE